MRILVFGVGGVGGFYGGQLARAGCDVVFVARGEHLNALRSEGLHVSSVAGDFLLEKVEATDDPAVAGEVDYVLMATKAWQVREAAERVRPLLSENGAVVTLQNGVEAPLIAADVLGRDRVLPGSVRIFSFIDSPGRIKHIGGPANIAFAEWDNRPTARVQWLRDVFSRAGVSVEQPADIHAALWEKFIFVVPMGTVGALTRAPIGVIREIPETRQLLEEAVTEIANIASARQIALPDRIIEKTISSLDAMPHSATSSLQRDLADGRASELEDWAGAVVRLGEESGVPVPLHRTVYRGMLPMERRARGVIDF